MSTLYVDNLEPNLGSQVEIPDLKPLAGSVVQCQVHTQTIGNVAHDADIENMTVSGSGGFNTAATINTVSITPKYNDSLILMQWSGMVLINGTGAGGADMFFSKDDVNLLTSGGNRNAVGFIYTGNSGEFYQMNASQYSFTSGQTTSMTLKVEVAPYNTGKTVGIQHDGVTTLTVWEIAQ